MIEIEYYQRILIISPQTDDGELGAGGAIAKGKMESRITNTEQSAGDSC